MNKAYIPAILSILLLAILHKIAIDNYWYVRFFGLDIFMHILGGVGIAFSIYWILSTFFPNYRVSFWFIVALTFAAGILWEAFEAINGIAGAPFGTKPYYLDTVKDLIDDTIGAVVAAFFIKK